MPLLNRRCFLLLPLAAAACAQNAPPPPMRTDFPKLDYSYLNKLPLNVVNIDFDNQSRGGDVDAIAPVTPAPALLQMAQTRLLASGSSGRAVFTVIDAKIVRTAAGLEGRMAVRLDVMTGNGNPVGFAEARASRVMTGAIPDPRAASYDLTRQMMEDMNVEFEFQVRHSLRDWLITGAVGAAPVQSQSLPSAL